MSTKYSEDKIKLFSDIQRLNKELAGYCQELLDLLDKFYIQNLITNQLRRKNKIQCNLAQSKMQQKKEEIQQMLTSTIQMITTKEAPSLNSSKQSEHKCSEKLSQSQQEDQLLEDVEEIHHTDQTRDRYSRNRL